jgi:hypothetical protein
MRHFTTVAAEKSGQSRIFVNNIEKVLVPINTGQWTFEVYIYVFKRLDSFDKRYLLMIMELRLTFTTNTASACNSLNVVQGTQQILCSHKMIKSYYSRVT